MSTRTFSILKAINIIFWVIFIGLCIKTGAILFSYFTSMFIDPIAAKNLSMGLNLSELYDYGTVPYSLIVLTLIVLTGLKAYIGYWVVKISRQLKIGKPFSSAIKNLLVKMSHVALWAGLLAVIGQAYSNWLMKQDIPISINWAYGEILFFAGIIYFITQVFKKGIELQTENELTI